MVIYFVNVYIEKHANTNQEDENWGFAICTRCCSIGLRSWRVWEGVLLGTAAREDRPTQDYQDHHRRKTNKWRFSSLRKTTLIRSKHSTSWYCFEIDPFSDMRLNLTWWCSDIAGEYLYFGWIETLSKYLEQTHDFHDIRGRHICNRNTHNREKNV